MSFFSPRIKIAVVEDVTMWREIIVKCVRESNAGVVVGQAATLAEATALLRVEKPNVALLDLYLGGEDGLSLCRLLRDELPRTRWLILTANARLYVVREALRLGVAGILTKAHDIRDTIGPAIARVARGQEAYSPEVVEKMAHLLRHEAELRLSPREDRVLRALAEGKSPKEIAFEMDVEHGTIGKYIQRIREKLDLEQNASTALLLQHAETIGLLTLGAAPETAP